MKHIISLIVGLALAVSASAQSHKAPSFLNVGAIQATNLLQFTNLYSAISAGSNVVGATYTNNSGTRVVVASGNGEYVNPFKDVPLWSAADGNWWSQTSTNYTDTTFVRTPVSIVVKSIAQSGANAAVTIAVAPVYADDIVGSTGRPLEVTGTTVREVYSFTPTASATQVWQFPVSLYKWPGAKYLRVLYVHNADTDASSQVTITDLSLCGFQP